MASAEIDELQTFYKSIKPSVKRSLSRSKAKFNQFQLLEPWNDNEESVQGFLIKKKLAKFDPPKKERSKRKTKGYLEPGILQLNQYIEEYPERKSANDSHYHMPSLVSIKLYQQKKHSPKNIQASVVKRSFSLPLIHKPKKTLFNQRKTLGLGDLRQQKIVELKDCINSQILRMDDFQSLKSKILKI